MKLEIKNVKIEKLVLKNDSCVETSNSSPSPYWLFPGIVHNLMLQQVLGAIPSFKIKSEKAQEIFKMKIIDLNKNLELGYNEEDIKAINVLPPKGENIYDYLKNILLNGGNTGPFNPEPSIVEKWIEVLDILEKNKENLKKSAMELSEFYKNNIRQVNNKEVFTKILSITYHSAKLYSKKENRIQLLKNVSNDDVIKHEASINWWKVAGCDGLGLLAGGVGAVIASGCSAINQS
ncbi:hypothetical protein [uncultured Winogradskyella sp.]|uniref:hypothetical protein n=1 Tax=uncultured Winogradskyella sp. TaxID=395353 RepID=UPI002629C51F|nr:hypothetical protein [uncultured Winogradskyella sp.]